MGQRTITHEARQAARSESVLHPNQFFRQGRELQD
jgi:hypothetical protein